MISASSGIWRLLPASVILLPSTKTTPFWRRVFDLPSKSRAALSAIRCGGAGEATGGDCARDESNTIKPQSAPRAQRRRKERLKCIRPYRDAARALQETIAESVRSAGAVLGRLSAQARFSGTAPAKNRAPLRLWRRSVTAEPGCASSIAAQPKTLNRLHRSTGVLRPASLAAHQVAEPGH